MINFPDTPITNQQFSAAGCIYTWDGQKWRPQTSASGVVTSVTAGAGLSATPNPIVSSGTLSLANTFSVTGPVTVNANAAALPAGVAGHSNNLLMGAADGVYNITIGYAFGGGVQYRGRVSNGTGASKTAITTSSGSLIELMGEGWDGTNYFASGSIVCQPTENWTSAAHGGQLVFRATASGTIATDIRAVLQRGLQIYGAGNAAPTGGDLGPGTINAAGAITSGAGVSATGYQVRAGSAGALGGSQFNINWTGSAQLWIDTTNLGTFSFTSDERIKANIAPSTFDCIAALQQVDLYRFQWRDSSDLEVPLGEMPILDEMVPVGFVAQRLAETFPEAVIQGDVSAERLSHVWQIENNVMLATLVGAVKQLAARVQALEDRSGPPIGSV